MLAAAQAIKDAGLMDYPLAASDKPGWDLAAEFVNMYLGTGGEFFAAGSAELAIDNDNGRKVLETMRAMTGFMNPDYLTYDANELNKLWDAGTVAHHEPVGLACRCRDRPGHGQSRNRRQHRLCRGADHRRRHDPGRGPVVGRLHHRQEHLGRRRRGLVPGDGQRHQPGNRRRQPQRRDLAGRRVTNPARRLSA